MCKETSVGGFSVMEDSIADRKVRNKDLLAQQIWEAIDFLTYL